MLPLALADEEHSASAAGPYCLRGLIQTNILQRMLRWREL